ncbi:hypothetical protein CKO31_02170 [Thiohalocapsa halophila]|uniref:Uncharacterized protein n=1 Tax=Thiohalocapsa halophila TaxID=69359 RepID=A0ABS1CCU9_9GAMM|nr:hypothetical protein [Thiohalocapsa halophila]MBK1629563.1 hypothetical protein [Thiohalocapsa halophila]
MDSSSIQLADSHIDSIEHTAERLRIHFSRAVIIKTMTGSAEKTLWWQSGDLLLDAPELDGPVPEGPLACAGGDIDDNIYTYRDMIPLPLSSRGAIRVELHFQGEAPDLVASGSAIELKMHDVPKYQRHIRDE